MDTLDLIRLLPQLYSSRGTQQICGVVLNEKHGPATKVKVSVLRDGHIVGQTTTDRSGDYLVMLDEPGYYDILITHPHYDSILAKCNIVTAGNNTTVNANLRKAHRRAKCATIEGKPILIDKFPMDR